MKMIQISRYAIKRCSVNHFTRIVEPVLSGYPQRMAGWPLRTDRLLNAGFTDKGCYKKRINNTTLSYLTS